MSPLSAPPPEPEDEDEDEPVYFCPHGVEVPTSGGACDRCATEDARDDDGPFGDTLGGWGI